MAICKGCDLPIWKLFPISPGLIFAACSGTRQLMGALAVSDEGAFPRIRCVFP